MLRLRLVTSSVAAQFFGALSVGTKATKGANVPAKFSSTSSKAVLPRSAMRQTPIAISVPTKKECAGV